MIIVDSLYGEFKVEPVFEALIQTKEVQRLKHIHQGGASYLAHPHWNVTRYEHSVGVMLLLRTLGASIEEQIVGLLHDVSHTAFSHVIDFALKNQAEDYHEHIYEAVIKQSKIPAILAEHGYDESILYDDSQWPILEQPLPKLCADRVDYTLRDMYRYGYVSKGEVLVFLKSLLIKDNELVVTSLQASTWFVQTYYREVIDFFYEPLNIYAYDRLSKALSMAFEIGELTLDDLQQDDETVLNLLKQSSSEKIKEYIASIHPNVKLEENEEDYDIFLKGKSRMIDPTVVIDNRLVKTSDVSPDVTRFTEQALIKSNKGLYLKVLS